MTNPPAVIRRAAAADARTLATLRFELRAEVHHPVEPEGDFVERCERWMSSHLGNDWMCWIAEIRSAPVGNVWVHRFEKIPNPNGDPECHAYLTNFFVRPHARGAGVGSALITEALSWCRARNVDSVILWPTPKSRMLYERHGFSAAGIMERPLQQQ